MDIWLHLSDYLEQFPLRPLNKTYLTSSDLLKDILLLREIFPSSSLQNTGASLFLGWILKELTFDSATVPWQWQCLHGYAEIVRRVCNLPGWSILKDRLPSHRGFENQLFTTFFFQAHTVTEAIEDAIPNVKADIALSVDNVPLFVEVKTIDQADKQ